MGKTVSAFLGGALLGGLLVTVVFALYLRAEIPQKSVRGEQVILKLGHGLSINHPVHKAIEFMKERLAMLSGDTVIVEIYPGAILGSETQVIEQIQNGSLAMAKTSAAAIENFVPKMALFSLPYLFRSQAHYWAVVDGPIGQQLLASGEEKFLLGLCYYDAGSRNFYTREKPILTPADLEGLKIRVMKSPTAVEMIEYLGGSPVPIAWGELYSALAQGIVDGAENNLPSFTTNKHYEVAKHLTLDAHSRIPDVLLISTKIWETLTPQVQQWLREAAKESSKFQRKLWQKMAEQSLQEAKEKGVSVYSVDQMSFASKVAPMLEALENKEVRDLVRQVRQEPTE